MQLVLKLETNIGEIRSRRTGISEFYLKWMDMES